MDKSSKVVQSEVSLPKKASIVIIVGGKDRDDVLADFSKQIKQKLAG